MPSREITSDSGAAAPTDEETLVIALVAQGVKDSVISTRLGVSLATVRRRIYSFQQKVGAKSRSHAVAIGVRRGWF